MIDDERRPARPTDLIPPARAQHDGPRSRQSCGTRARGRHIKLGGVARALQIDYAIVRNRSVDFSGVVILNVEGAGQGKARQEYVLVGRADDDTTARRLQRSPGDAHIAGQNDGRVGPNRFDGPGIGPGAITHRQGAAVGRFHKPGVGRSGSGVWIQLNVAAAYIRVDHTVGGIVHNHVAVADSSPACNVRLIRQYAAANPVNVTRPLVVGASQDHRAAARQRSVAGQIKFGRIPRRLQRDGPAVGECPVDFRRSIILHNEVAGVGDVGQEYVVIGRVVNHSASSGRQGSTRDAYVVSQEHAGTRRGGNLSGSALCPGSVSKSECSAARSFERTRIGIRAGGASVGIDVQVHAADVGIHRP